MSCCGRNRALAQVGAWAPGAARSHAAPLGLDTSVVMFEYVGRGSAVIRGPATGLAYRFNGTGDRVRVDARDRPGLAAMTALLRVR